MIIRIVHKQAVADPDTGSVKNVGPLILTDIDQGLPREFLDEERKQSSYIPYYHKSFVPGVNGSLRVVEDRTRPGFIDLVLSDKVRQSLATGELSVLARNGLLDAIEIPTGALEGPVLESVGFEGEGEGEKLVLKGQRFESFAPDITQIRIGEEILTQGEDDDDVEVVVTGTEITIRGLELEEGEVDVVVIANGKVSETVPLVVGDEDEEDDDEDDENDEEAGGAEEE